MKADLVVVGAGAGGAMVAREAARAGVSVILVEEGPRLATRDFTQREDEMIPRLFQDGGARTTVDGAITVLQGRGVGGSTVHNTNLCKRAPDEVLESWKLDGWRPKDLAPHYEVVERDLSVAPIALDRVNRNNALLRDGADKLGWKNGLLSHNRIGCVGSGFCELGCAFDAKQNALKVLVPQAIAAGAQLVENRRVDEIVVEKGRAVGVRVQGERIDGAVCLSGSAVGSAALALASRLPGDIGRTLRLHPGAAVAGLFDDNVEGWWGIPQSWECTEQLRFDDDLRRTWIITAFAHPVGMAAMLPGFGAEHMNMMRLYPRLAVFAAMLHDQTAGTVTLKKGRPQIRYQLTESDQRALLHGMQSCAQLLFAAGARVVYVPFAETMQLRSPSEISRISAHGYRPLDPLLTAVHPMGTLPLGQVVDEKGGWRGVEKLWVSDGSLFPTSLGGPPQLTIYAAAHKVAGHIVEELRR
jgi:choline dehydrogenase-like flavoprotein